MREFLLTVGGSASFVRSPRDIVWIGALAAAFGWGLLITALLIAIIQGNTDAIQNMLRLGESAIFTGLAVGIIGALVHNSVGRLRAPRHMSAPPARHPGELATDVQKPAVVARGMLGDREYSLLSDGSVGIETLLGPRRFQSLAEAKQFVGA